MEKGVPRRFARAETRMNGRTRNGCHQLAYEIRYTAWCVNRSADRAYRHRQTRKRGFSIRQPSTWKQYERRGLRWRCQYL